MTKTMLYITISVYSGFSLSNNALCIRGPANSDHTKTWVSQAVDANHGNPRNEMLPDCRGMHILLRQRCTMLGGVPEVFNRRGNMEGRGTSSRVTL